MKRFLLSIAALLCLTMANAQEVGGYKATTSKEDFSLLEGGTVVNANIAASELSGMVILSDNTVSGWDSASGKGFPIGFEFPYCGKNFSYFAVAANGMIRLSETEDMTVGASSYFYSQSDEKYNDLVFCYDKYAQSYETGNEAGEDTTTISYKTTDEGLVVEWKALGMNTSSWNTNLIGTYTMQMFLMKDGTIKYRFAGLENVSEDDGAGSVLLGLRADIDEYLTFSDFTASTSKFGGYPSGFNLTPLSDGYTITLNTPEETVTPTVQPTNLNTEVSYHKNNTSVNVTFDDAEGADKYLMLISEGAPTELPVDGDVYAEGDYLGNGLIMLAGNQSSWGANAYDLAHDAEYYVTVYAYNSFGKGGTKYNTVDPLQAIFYTAPAQPGEMTITATTANTVTVKVAPNEKNQQIFVVYNDETTNPGNMGNRPYIGAFDSTNKPGDKLIYDGFETEINWETWEEDTTWIHEEAGTVAYFGEPGEFTVEGLDPSHSYYFIAYSYDDLTDVFSQGMDFVQAWTSTNITVPFELDLTKAPDCQAPGGWISAPYSDYNQGFIVDKDIDYSKVKSQTEGNYVFQCQNDPSVTDTLMTPEIELTTENKLSFDWHVHIMSGFSWMQSAALYDEWGEDDVLEFVIYDGDERTVLKKYTADNAPINPESQVYEGEGEEAEYVSSRDWHSESFDISEFEGKNVRFAVEWLGANNSTLYLGIENIKIDGAEPEPAVDLAGQWYENTTGQYYDYYGAEGEGWYDFSVVNAPVTATQTGNTVTFTGLLNDNMNVLTATIAADGKTMTFAKGQTVYYGYYDWTLTYDPWAESLDEDLVAKINENGSISLDGLNIMYAGYTYMYDVVSTLTREVDAINSISASAKNVETPMYNLSGQRVNCAVRNGVTIQNGKKVIK